MMPGPAPKPDHQRRRRNAAPGTVLLPAEGYQGKTPAWPIGGKQSGAEIEAWRDLWKLPQAEAWAQMRLERTVARYVRALVKAERPGAVAFLLSEVRQLEDRLGLTPMSMLRLRWEVVSDELAEQRDETAGHGHVSKRLRAVE